MSSKILNLQKIQTAASPALPERFKVLRFAHKLDIVLQNLKNVNITHHFKHSNPLYCLWRRSKQRWKHTPVCQNMGCRLVLMPIQRASNCKEERIVGEIHQATDIIVYSPGLLGSSGNPFLFKHSLHNMAKIEYVYIMFPFKAEISLSGYTL